MELLWVITAVLSGVLALFFADGGAKALYDNDTEAAKKLFLISAILLATTVFSIYKGVSVSKDKPHVTVVSTTTTPQIDTIITYSPGKADTIYVYHLKED